MKYRHKVKIEQKTTKIKGQKRRVAEHGPWEGKYTDEEIASMVDYDYDYLLDTMYYKMERMVAFFNSKHTHIAGAKKVAKQIEVALRLLNIIRGKSVTYDEKELEKIVNTSMVFNRDNSDNNTGEYKFRSQEWSLEYYKDPTSKKATMSDSIYNLTSYSR